MKSQLSNLMPVAQACDILGEERVIHIIKSILCFQRQSPHFIPSSANPQSQQSSVDEEAQMLAQAMLYTASSSSSSFPDQNTSMKYQDNLAARLPPPIRDAWKRLSSRSMLLDKIAFLRFAVPISAQPHAGPGGHMGLFDCLFYALQQKTSLSSSASPSQTSGTSSSLGVSGGVLPLVSIPDLCIFLAICKSYTDLRQQGQQQTEEGQKNIDDETTPSGPSSVTNEHPAIVQMSQWMFIVYDAYQKKNHVARDTLHRFLSDIHGDDSYKAPTIRDVLDTLFEKSSVLTSREFVESIADTMTWQPDISHVLLDWMGVLSQAIMPPAAVPESVTQFLQTIEQDLHFLPKVCARFGLAESRLYEIKRRFHSLVESASTIIQGNPMQEEGGEDTDSNSIDVENSLKQEQNRLPKHAISLPIFVKAVNPFNDEVGHGGYLPESLARQVFAFRKAKANANATANLESSQYWDLTNVLQFGGAAVRSDSDAPLVRWIAELFGTSRLSRDEIGQLLLCLVDHWTFRMVNDSPHQDMWEETPKQTESVEPEATVSEKSNGVQHILVDASKASLLGLMPKDVDPSIVVTPSNDGSGQDQGLQQIPLSALIDQVFQESESSCDTLSADELLAWNEKSNSEVPKDQQRLGPLMLELRLIASVLFGVPPKYASMEFDIISEIQRRHKSRYPQTEVSRRGPRGTVWYIVEHQWHQTWNNLIQKVSGTPDDGQDLRGEPISECTPRRLGRISNTGLLRENGSLALRTDIKWRHDYEIIPPLAWLALQAWYDGGPPIHRVVVPYIPSSASASPHVRSSPPKMRTENEIELYPYFVTVFMCDASSRGDARPFQQAVPVSQVSPLRVLSVQLCKGLGVDPKFGRLWMIESASEGSSLSLGSSDSSLNTSSHGDWLLDLDKNIGEQRKKKLGVDQGSSNIKLLLELKDEESGLWPRGVDGRQWSFREKKDDGAPDTGDGVVGMYNMGNTCYLNSSVQCLSHTPIFRDYFTSKCYLNDINTTNPIGHQGRLAQVSAVLINNLWKRFNNQAPHQPKRVTAPGSYAPVAAPSLTPKTFKESLGKFNEIFSGNEQHDAQELLAFLLGGLSEDLNRIVDKPYIEAPDSDGRPDSELADIWWSNHLRREMSIIVALFTGQYKSLLTCRLCKYESARFEPFSFLQLPLPEDDHISVSLVLYPIRERTETMKYSVRVHNNGKLYDVLLALAKTLHTDELADGAPDSKEVGSDETTPKLKEPVSEAELKRLEEIYEQRAQNLAVVDMREGYIFKIAPTSWALPDLQNKDTGELPLLHVYEMDPLSSDSGARDGTKICSDSAQRDGFSDEVHSGSALPVDSQDDMDKSNETDSGEDDDSSDEEQEKNEHANHAFLAICQRRSQQVLKDALHPLSHRVFGTPLLLRVSGLENLTGRDLYDLVATRLRNFVPAAALTFLVDTSDRPSDDKAGSKPGTKNGQSQLESRQKLKKTTTDMEEVAAGQVPRYGFALRIGTRDGRRCGLCPWYECCIGCFVPDDDFQTVVMNGDSIVIDWHFAVDVATSGFGTRSHQVEQPPQGSSPFRARAPGVPIKNHSSCGNGAKQKGYPGAITLEDCLDAFAKEERIPEAYCSRCKDFRVQTKRMSLWRLPPIVIIHLKRFQFTQHMRRKLRDFVAFPVEGLDLSRIMAADNGSPIQPDIKNEDGTAASGEGGQSVPAEANDRPAINGDEIVEDGDEDGTTMTQESAATPLTTQDSGRSEMLYDLYGVVHHQGALSGGHYVASLKSELDGKWRLFNDAQIYEIHSRDVVDSSAYILFYIRRDVQNSKLSDFWETNPRDDEDAMTEEDLNKLIRGRSDRCVIS